MRIAPVVKRASGALLLLLLVAGPSPGQLPPEHEARARVFFSPRGGCRAAVIGEINLATKSVHVLAYVLTDAPIAQALLSARLRGCEVIVLCDATNETDRNSFLPWLALQWAGVLVYVDRHAGIAHNKTMILDDVEVITGSYNWSAAAEEDNAENLLLLKGQTLVDAYREDWQKHLGHARWYLPRQRNGPRMP